MIDISSTRIKDIVDTIISHNEIVALWIEKKDEVSYHELLWRGMAHQIPQEYQNYKFVKIFGTIPESIMQADTINIEVSPTSSILRCKGQLSELNSPTKLNRVYPKNYLYMSLVEQTNIPIYRMAQDCFDDPRNTELPVGFVREAIWYEDSDRIDIVYDIVDRAIIDSNIIDKLCLSTACSGNIESTQDGLYLVCRDGLSLEYLILSEASNQKFVFLSSERI